MNFFWLPHSPFPANRRGGRSDREIPRGGGGVRSSCEGGASFRAPAVRGGMPAKSGATMAARRSPSQGSEHGRRERPRHRRSLRAAEHEEIAPSEARPQ